MFESHIKPALLAHAPLVAKIGTRIRPLMALQNEETPYVAYAVGDGEDPAPSNDGKSGFERCEFDLVVVARTYPEVTSISVLVKDAMTDYSGDVDGTEVVWTQYVTQGDVEQQPEEGTGTPIYMRTVTMKSLYK